MSGDRTGERVLGVGVDVHLDDAEVQRILDLGLQRSRSTVEDEIEGLRACGQAELGSGDLLALFENLGLELDVARLVDAVDVAEGGCEQVLALFADAQSIDRLLEVFTRSVEACR